MANAADIITIADYEGWVGNPSSTAYDAQVQIWITEASVAIAAYCNCSPSMMVADRTDDFDGGWDEDGGLRLAARPINSVATITQDPYNTPTTIPAADVYWLIGRYTLYLKESSEFYPIWRGLIQVTYNAGFATAPYDLRLACMLVVQTLEHLSSPQRDTVSQKVRDVEQAFNPIKWSILDPVFMQAAQLLNQYRIPTCI